MCWVQLSSAFPAPDTLPLAGEISVECPMNTRMTHSALVYETKAEEDATGEGNSMKFLSNILCSIELNFELRELELESLYVKLFESGNESSSVFATPWTVVLGILQARILKWVAFPFSRGSSQPRDRTQVSHIAGRFFTSWTEPLTLFE